MKPLNSITLMFFVLLVACTPSTKTPDPADNDALQASTTLAAIDSLMWQQPDSAFAMLQEFASSAASDSLDEFNGHYCQVLIAELLFKNDYGQSNREEVLKAVHYFDSIVGMDGADARGASVRKRDAFLAARAHYMNGVGLYERDSVVAACGEYLKALEMVETHFPNLERQVVAALQIDHLPRFMALTYNRLGDLFSSQFMQEPAIVCYKKSLVFNKIEPTSANGMANIMSHLGKQYNKLNQNDSTVYYFNEGLRMLPDTNNLIYRDLISQLALFNYKMSKDAETSISDLKRMVAQAADESEKLTRYLIIGAFYADVGQNDSALKYLTPVFMYKDDCLMTREAARCMRDIYQSQGDSLKVIQYAMYLIDNEVHEGESNAQVSQLNELFQRHLQWEQEKAEAERRQTEQLAARRRLVQGVVTAVVVLLVLGLGLWWWMAKRRKEHEAETQTWHEEKQQLQTQVDDALQQARAMLPQRANEIYSSKVGNRLERIMAEFETAYPKALEQLAAAYPDLTQTERRIFVLSHLQFRAKEMADLLGLSENTVNQYRYNLRKKTENTSFSEFLD